MTARLLERALQAEMIEHVGYEPGRHKPEGRENGRSGFTSKTLRTESGELTVQVPRDRAGTFDPQPVKKRERHIDAAISELVVGAVTPMALELALAVQQEMGAPRRRCRSTAPSGR